MSNLAIRSSIGTATLALLALALPLGLEKPPRTSMAQESARAAAFAYTTQMRFGTELANVDYVARESGNASVWACCNCTVSWPDGYCCPPHSDRRHGPVGSLIPQCDSTLPIPVENTSMVQGFRAAIEEPSPDRNSYLQ